MALIDNTDQLRYHLPMILNVSLTPQIERPLDTAVMSSSHLYIVSESGLPKSRPLYTPDKATGIRLHCPQSSARPPLLGEWRFARPLHRHPEGVAHPATQLTFGLTKAPGRPRF